LHLDGAIKFRFEERALCFTHCMILPRQGFRSIYPIDEEGNAKVPSIDHACGE